MKKFLFLLFLLPLPAKAAGPIILHKDPNIQREFQNVYDDIRTVNISSMTDYSNSSTVTGWASFTKKKIMFTKLGNLLLVYFDLEGTSNSTAASFTIPSSGMSVLGILTGAIQASDNSVALTTPGQYSISSGASTVNLYKDMAAGAWTNVNTKICIGWFVLPVT